MSEKQATRRSDYLHFAEITTRWSDNDVYGHVNNVTYYSYFDSVVNEFLIREGGLDIQQSKVVGVVAESGCRYHSPLAYPSKLEAGLRVEHLGNRSVRYGIGIFETNSDSPAAEGFLVHVFVGKNSGKPISIPDAIRAALETLV